MLLSMYSCIYMSPLNVLKYTHPCYVNVFSFQVVVSVTLKHSLTLYNKNFYLYVVLTLFLCFFSTFFIRFLCTYWNRIYLSKLLNIYYNVQFLILIGLYYAIYRKRKFAKFTNFQKYRCLQYDYGGCILIFVTGI